MTHKYIVDREKVQWENMQMLTKDDIKQIEEMIAKTISETFNGMLFPYLEEKFQAIDKRFDDHDKRFDAHDKRFDDNDKEHDRIFRALEINRDEHDQMFQKLDEIESHVKDHGKRIKRLESITAS